MKPLAAVAAVLLVLLGALEARAEPSGSALPGLEVYDELMAALLKKWDVPGAGLAVAHKDKLILVRGYGFANKERSVAVGPASLFRVASLSKTITAVAVLQLVQGGRLELDDKVLPILGDAGPRPDRITDSRVRDITVRHLLQHSGGFDRDRSGDVAFLPRAADAAQRQGGPLPPDCPTILRDTLERTLDFAPGERFAYSNIGYCILGRVVERVTGSPYEAHVREHVLAPAGVTRMQVGRTLQPAEGEVTYYDYRGAKEVKAMPGLGLRVAPQPYGAFALETMDSYGGWIAAPIDYLRFILAIDGRRGAALLNATSLAEMNAPALKEATGGEEWNGNGVYYGLGIRVRPVRNGANLFHTGSIPGTSTLAIRTADGFAWVVMFNGRPQDKNGFRADVDRGLWAAKGKVKRWPSGDLF
ncbi:MAG TPA: serine hydrolase domain-containing protein [Candidatus Binatia bacterium]|nr:serine hydrolase domain-containing protein [Candidatus Binatia bacterium]